MIKSNIKHLREKMNMTQEELSRECDVSTRTIQNLEKKVTRNMEILIKIKKVLNCKLDEMFIVENKEE